jgi:hypothetical protein
LKILNFLSYVTGLDRKQAAAGHDDKHHETSRLLLSVAWRFAVLFAVLAWSAEIWELTLEFLHLALEGLHLLIEGIEELSELILEHLLDTNHHESEIILFNTALVLMAYGLYRLYRAAPRLYRQWRRNCRAAWLRYKRRKLFYWRSLSEAQKATLMAAYLTGIVLLLYWLTL